MPRSARDLLSIRVCGGAIAMEQQTLSDGPEPRRRHGLLLWSVLTVLIVLAAVAVWWWRGRNPPLHYITARVTQGDIQRAVNMTGTLNPVVTAQVESFVSGNIKSWSCEKYPGCSLWTDRCCRDSLAADLTQLPSLHKQLDQAYDALAVRIARSGVQCARFARGPSPCKTS